MKEQPSKSERKRLLIEMMKEDEKNGMYEVPSKTDNELIAEFMGFEKTGTFYETQGLRHDKYKSPDFGYTYPAEWAFNRKWDWLMPVVQAIEDLEEPHPSNDPTKGTVWPYQVEILSRSVVQIIDNRNDESIVLVDDQDHRKIDSVYKAVVEFIKFYNSQQHER